LASVSSMAISCRSLLPAQVYDTRDGKSVRQAT
jgi:hypothetical protein